MREKWFKYVMDNKDIWCHGVTLKRLEKVKEDVLNDRKIMQDLLIRHDGNNLTPEKMKNENKEMFNHAIFNFTCSIFWKMRDMGILKK